MTPSGRRHSPTAERAALVLAFADVAEHIKSDAERRAREHGQTLATQHRAF